MAIKTKPNRQRAPLVSGRRAVASAEPALALLVPILALALSLRLWGITWSLPWVFQADELHYADKAQEMLQVGDLNPKYFMNPSLLTYVVAGELLLARAFGSLAGPLSADTPASANLLARLDSALLGTASVGLLFAVGSAMFSRRVGLLAAAFLAVAFLHVRNSHYGVNDVPGAALLLLSLYCDARLLRGPRLRWYVLAGLAGGLATSTKYNMGFFFVPLLAAHWLAAGDGAMGRWRDGATGRRGEDDPVALPSRRLPALGLAGAASLIGYLAGTPYTLLDFGHFVEDFRIQNSYADGRWLGQPEGPVPLLHLTTLLQGFGALPLALALAGLGLAWRQRRAEAILLVAFPAVYLAFLLPKELFFPRLSVPLLPFCSLLAGYGTNQLVARLRPAWRGAGLALLLAAALAQPVASDVAHNRILLQADTRVLANEWIQANLPPGSRVQMEYNSLRDLSQRGRSYAPSTAGLHIHSFGMNGPEPEQARYLVDQNVQYVVTSSFAFEKYQVGPQPGPEWAASRSYQRLHRSLEQQTELVARFSPGIGGQEVTYALEDSFTPFWNLWQYERNGPTIRIYSLAALAARGSR